MTKKKDLAVPFLPSWQTRFLHAVDHYPVSNIVVYFALFTGIGFFQHLIPWMEGRLPWGQVEWRHFNFLMPAFIVFTAFSVVLAYSEKTMAKFRKALNVSETEYALLSYQFLNLPASTGWLITIALAALIAFIYKTPVFQSVYPANLLLGVSGLLIFVVSWLGLSVVFAFFVFVLRQTRLVGQLYARVQNINLFNLGPLYTLSLLTSRVGTLFIIVGTLSFINNFLLVKGDPQVQINIFFGVINVALAAALFILPLLGIHQRLVTKKEELLSEAGERVRAAFDRLNKEQATGRLNEIGNTRQLVDAMIREREYIQAVPTWPWNAGTLRTFLTTLLVPLTVWLIQQVVLRTVVK
ncbi:MAG TPA: hypothetical protein VLK33_00065 [Terriglobales bacterium]|nr:hypothetical protein [Terriglobales bacterium]